MEEQDRINSRCESSWTDTQKHVVETTIKITGWGVAAGFIFAGWLMTGQSLNWKIKPGTCVLVIGATIAICTVWYLVVRGAARTCQEAFPTTCPQTDNHHDDPTRMVRRTPTLSWVVGLIVVLVTTLACFDDMLDATPTAPTASNPK